MTFSAPCGAEKIILDITIDVEFIISSAPRPGGSTKAKKVLFMNNQLTSGSVLKSILRFSLPYLLSYFLQTLYGLADLFIIGQFQGAEGTTAVSIGSQVMHMLTVMIVGLAMGTTVSVGQAVGAGAGGARRWTSATPSRSSWRSRWR